MKKFFSMMVAVAAMFAFAACETTPDEPVKPEGGKLATPVLEVVDVTETGFTVTWAAVENAASYSVVLKGKPQNVTENRVVFTNLNKGSYTVRVKAVGAEGSNWTDSAYAETTAVVSGLTSADWFSQELFTATDEEAGAYPYNSLFFTWKGTGVKAISYGFFETAMVEGVDEATILANMEAFDDPEVIAEINSEEGATYYFGELYGDTSYTLFALVTNEDGLEFFTSTVGTTEVAETSEAAAKWLGAWNLTSHETITFAEDGSVSFNAKDETFTVNIYGNTSDPNGVVLDGFSVLGEGWPALGKVEDNKLFVMSGDAIGATDDGFYYIWLSYFMIGDTGKGQHFSENLPIQIFSMDDAGNVTCEMYVAEGQTNDGSKVALTAANTEIYLIDPNSGQLYFVIEAFPAVYRSGAMDMVRAEASATSKKFSKGPKRQAVPAGINSGISVVF